MKTTILVHGFNVSDSGSGTVEKLRPALGLLDNMHVTSHYYGWLGFIGVYLCNRRIASTLANRVENFNKRGKVCAIGHSNGCAILLEAARQGAVFDHVVFINPALRTNSEIPASISHLLIIHTKNDQAVRLAQFVESIPFLELLIPNFWGAMGAYGYKGLDRRVINLDLTHSLDSHSAFFEDKNVRMYGSLVSRWIEGTA
jgi:pimeloyl-ACP methyl ester carboxylesterase